MQQPHDHFLVATPLIRRLRRMDGVLYRARNSSLAFRIRREIDDAISALTETQIKTVKRDLLIYCGHLYEKGKSEKATIVAQAMSDWRQHLA